MAILQVSERDLNEQGIPCVAVPTLTWNGLKYIWLSCFSGDMSELLKKHCQEMLAQGRTALVVTHDNGEVTIWQGPKRSAQAIAARPQGQGAGISLAAEPGAAPQTLQPQPEGGPAETRAVTMKYRGISITKQVAEIPPSAVPQTPTSQLQGDQARTIKFKYRGQIITKQMCPVLRSLQHKGERSYRGQKY